MIICIPVKNQWPRISRLLGMVHKTLHDLAHTQLSSLTSHPRPILPYAPVIPTFLASPLAVLPFCVPAPPLLHPRSGMLFFSSLTSWGELIFNLSSGITSQGKWGLYLYLLGPNCASSVHLQLQCVNLFKCLPSHDRFGAPLHFKYWVRNAYGY